MFSDMLEASDFALPTDDAMKERLGLLLEGDGTITRVVTTNGHCLAVIEEPVPSVCSATMPRSVVAQVKALLADNNQHDIALARYDNVLTVDCGRRSLVTALQPMQFPDYRRVIPTSTSMTASFASEPASRATARLQAIADAEVKETTVTLSFGDGLTLKNRSGTDSVDCEVAGDRCDVSIASEYFIQALKACGERSTVRVSSPRLPITVSPMDGRRTFMIAPRAAK